MELEEANRVRVVVAILDEIHACEEALTGEIRALLAGGVAGPVTFLLNYGAQNDSTASSEKSAPPIGTGQYERSVTLTDPPHPTLAS